MKNSTKKFFLSILIFSMFSPFQLLSQFQTEAETGDKFLFDVVVFKGEPEPLGRVDFFVAVPYKYLVFTVTNNIYSASYDLTFELLDSTGKTVEVFHQQKIVREEDFYVTQGGTAEADFTQKVFMLPPGNYTARAIVTDAILNQEYNKSRSINVIDFAEYPFAISGVLLVSTIEEIDNKFKITPYIAENIANLPVNFFAFFEIYNNLDLDKINLAYEFVDKETNDVFFTSDIISKNIKRGRSQEFISIRQPELMPSGKYILRIISLKPGIVENTEANYLAVAQRTIEYVQSLGGIVRQDLDKAIKQLAYVATGKEVNYIQAAKTKEEKLLRFEDYWQKLDPSPGTPKNEAFQEYYSRIQMVNDAFSTYSEGWMTDRGMVYIIYGPPYNIERARNYTDGTIYEKWVYLNNQEFLFVDQSGFGDFRLIQPYAINDKYTYRR